MVLSESASIINNRLARTEHKLELGNKVLVDCVEDGLKWKDSNESVEALIIRNYSCLYIRLFIATWFVQVTYHLPVH